MGAKVWRGQKPEDAGGEGWRRGWEGAEIRVTWRLWCVTGPEALHPGNIPFVNYGFQQEIGNRFSCCHICKAGGSSALSIPVLPCPKVLLPHLSLDLQRANEAARHQDSAPT